MDLYLKFKKKLLTNTEIKEQIVKIINENEKLNFHIILGDCSEIYQQDIFHLSSIFFDGNEDYREIYKNKSDFFNHYFNKNDFQNIEKKYTLPNDIISSSKEYLLIKNLLKDDIINKQFFLNLINNDLNGFEKLLIDKKSLIKRSISFSNKLQKYIEEAKILNEKELLNKNLIISNNINSGIKNKI